MTDGQHQIISKDAIDAKSVLFITSTQEKQRLRIFRNVIAVRE